MVLLFENLMIGSFCCAIGIRLIQHICRKTYADLCERFTLFTIGIGFIIGVVIKYLSVEPWFVIIYCLGVYLTYVTLLLSCPPKVPVRNKEVGRHE